MPSSNPSEQFRMQLNTIEQGRHADFDFEEKSYGPDHDKTWVVIVKVTRISEKLAKKIPVGTSFEGEAKILSDATDAASKQMIELFCSEGIKPKTGRRSKA